MDTKGYKFDELDLDALIARATIEVACGMEDVKRELRAMREITRQFAGDPSAAAVVRIPAANDTDEDMEDPIAPASSVFLSDSSMDRLLSDLAI